MEENKKVYIIYGGDDIPYESCYPITSFLDKNKAEEFVKKLKEENDKNVKLYEEYSALYDKYSQHIVQKHIEFEDDDIIIEEIAKKFKTSKEQVQHVMDFYYYPQIYYIQTVDLND